MSRKLMKALGQTSAVVLTLFGLAPTLTQGANGGSVLDRVAKIRAGLEREKVQAQSEVAQGVEPTGPVRLAQWGNWPNWGNWGNWNNWGNWGNWPNWHNI
jgi:hypothetical protein